MFKIKNSAITIVGLLFIGGALIGFDVSNAQQTESKPAPTATASPTPEVIEEDDEVLNVDAEVVNVLFTAQDRNRRLLTDLKQGDVKLIEDGQAQEITAFSRQIDLPLSLAILIDTSRSQERTLPEEKIAAKSFLQSVLRPSKDEVAIVSFTGETTLEQGMTNNLSRLSRAIDRVEYVPPTGDAGGGVIVGTPPISGDNSRVTASTAIWDAVWITADEILGKSPDKTRRAFILLSDGDDTFSKKTFSEAVDKALKAEAVIYCIGIGDPYITTNYRNGINEKSLRQIAQRTGGSAFFPRDESELRKAFDQIQNEMRSQYSIAYEPTNQKRDGSYRKIEIQLVNPNLSKQKVALTHRQGYFAKTAGGQKPK